MIPALPLRPGIFPLEPGMLPVAATYTAVAVGIIHVVMFVSYVAYDFNRRWLREAPFLRAVEGYIIHIFPKYNWIGLGAYIIRTVLLGAVLGMILFTLALGAQELAIYYI